MSYYSKNHSSNDTSVNLIMIGICIVLMILLMSCTNSCSANTWNDGICPSCDVRYELRGVSRGLKYYSCPDCGLEVERY